MMFFFDVETYDEKECALPHGIGLYELIRQKYRYNWDSTDEKIKTERQHKVKFNGKNYIPVMQMIKYLKQNYKGEKIIHEDKSGARTVQFRLLKNHLSAHNSSGFDSFIVLNNLDNKNIPSLKIVKTDWGLKELSFRSENTGTKPHFIKTTCSNTHISGSLVEIWREYNVQLHLLRSVMSHATINEYNNNDFKLTWVPYLELSCLSLGVNYSRHAMQMRKLSHRSCRGVVIVRIVK